MAAKKKRAPKRPPETTDELEARVARKLAGKVAGVQVGIADARDIVRRGVLEAIDDFLDDGEG